MQSTHPFPQEAGASRASTKETISPSLLPSTSTQLLDKYVLPKVALTIISISSLVGVGLTMTTHGAGDLLSIVTRWLHLITLGVLAGGYMWKGALARPAADPDRKPARANEVKAFASAQFHRFRRVTAVALPIFAVTAVYDLIRFSRMGAGWPIWLDAMLLAIIVMLTLYELYIRRPGEPFAEQSMAQLLMVLLVVHTLFQATYDVTLSQGGAFWPLLVRWAHLAAFALWLGGAFWNIFIAVPAARQTLTIQVVVAAGRQLERFRVVVRIFLPALIITGFIQAYRYVGLSPEALFFSPIGRVILLKIGLVLALVGVFLTCPLWRACSPISGMCKLDELYDRQ